MPENELYVLSSGDRADDAESWVRPRPIPTAIAEAVAAATDRDVDDLDVEDAIDRDAVASLLDDEGAGDDETVTFTVEGNEVTVDGTGHVDVSE